MGQETVRQLRTAFAAYNCGDFDAATELFHRDVHWHFPRMAIGFQDLHGKEEVIDFWRSLADAFETFTLHPVELKEAGADKVLAHLRFDGRGRGSGVLTQIEWQVLYTFRDGLVARVDHYTERAAALDAAGLSQ